MSIERFRRVPFEDNLSIYQVQNHIAGHLSQVCNFYGQFRSKARSCARGATYTFQRSSVTDECTRFSALIFLPSFDPQVTHLFKRLLARVDGNAIDPRVKDSKWHHCALVVECSP